MRTMRFGITTVLMAGALLLIPALSSAQISLGAKIGANFGDVDGVTDLEVSKESDIVGGIYAQFGFGGRWGLQPELLYSARSAGLTSAEDDMSATIQQAFIEIPLLLNVRLMDGVFEPQLYAGPSYSMESSCEFDDVTGGTVKCSENDLDTNSSLWAGVAGIALDVDVGPLVLGLDGRYNYGFTDIDSETESGEDKATWRYFSLMLQGAIAIGR
jgi:hypothetical protein